MRQVRAHYNPGIPQELLQEVDDFFSRLRGSHPEFSISFSRQQEAKQQALSRKRPTAATKGPKPPAKKKRQALPPSKSRGGENNNNNINKIASSTGKSIQ